MAPHRAWHRALCPARCVATFRPWPSPCTVPGTATVRPCDRYHAWHCRSAQIGVESSGPLPSIQTMGRPLRFLPRPGSLVHITSRTVEGRFLLRPAPRQTSIAIGCLHRAQIGCEVDLHAVVLASNHVHLLISPASADDMARFVGRFKRNLTLAAQREHGWKGPVFSSRYDAIVVSDEPEAQVACLRYILSHGVKEDVVLSPEAWPGVHSAGASRRGEALRGEWTDRKALWRARRRGRDAEEADHTDSVDVELCPLPAWRHLDPVEQRRRISEMLSSIEEDARSRHRADGTKPTGPAAALKASPDVRPRREPAAGCPAFHCWSREMKARLVEAYTAFSIAYRSASDALLRGERGPRFPPGCFPPRGPFVPHLAGV